MAPEAEPQRLELIRLLWAETAASVEQEPHPVPVVPVASLRRLEPAQLPPTEFPVSWCRRMTVRQSS